MNNNLLKINKEDAVNKDGKIIITNTNVVDNINTNVELKINKEENNFFGNNVYISK